MDESTRNWDWVTPVLATGGDLSFDPDIAASQVDDIVEQGITLVIDMRVEDDNEDLWEQVDGIGYVNVGVEDSADTVLHPDTFDTVVGYARSEINRGGKVLVHCHMGINRGPSAAFAVLLDQGVPAVDAFDLVRAKRPIAGLSYAEDALRADNIRKGLRPTLGMTTFRLWVDQVFTPEVIRSIQHTMRRNHQNDRAVLARVQSRR